MDIYDEVIEIKNSREIDSPTDLDVTSAINFLQQDDIERLSDGEDQERSIEYPQTLPKMEGRPRSTIKRIYPGKTPSLSKSESFGSDSDSSGIDDNKIPAEGEFNPKEYENLDVPPDIKELFQFIPRYTPQRIDVDYKLQIFIPEYIPAVGDIDAFLKVIPPDPMSNKKEVQDFIAKLGLEILDEPSGQQSEPALLHMKLRSIITGPRTTSGPTAVAKSPKDIEKWISEIQILHSNQPAPTVIHNKTMPDIDSLMSEWPADVENGLDAIGFPNYSLDCSLSFYIDLVCSLLDIPIKTKTQSDYIIALYTLFNLYSAIRKPEEGL